MNTPLVAGNWKLNGSRASIRELVGGIREGLAQAGGAEVMVCPPYVYIPEVVAGLEGAAVFVAAQDVAAEESGAYTGEVSAAMLRDVGCTHTLIGHSERRSLFGDTDEQVAAKFVAAQAAGLSPIVCVGETLEQREADRTEAVVAAQLGAVIERAGVAALDGAILAYEPVWAIGTGRTATPDQAQAVHARLRALVAESDARIAADLRILYGGSVNADNAAALFSMPDIDGGLVGGASLDAEAFLGICRAASLNVR